MRSYLSALVLSATLAAQYAGEPPVLVTDPPVTSPTFGAAALGVVQVAQIGFAPMRDASGFVVPNQFYVAATCILAAGGRYQGWSGVYNESTGVITPNADVALLNNPAVDMFACNVSNDLLVAVIDTGGSTAPVVATRANTSLPFGTPVPIGAPVPAGYRDSQLFDKVGTNQYEYAYIDGRNLRVVTIDVTTGGTIGAPRTMVAVTDADVHSTWPMRQQITTNPLDAGKTRAIYFSYNRSSADAFFRSSVVDNGLIPVPLHPVYQASTNWLANPGNIRGDVYYANASATYIDPLKLETVCCSSAHLPLGGGLASVAGWAPRNTAGPSFGLIILGSLGASGIDLSFMGVKGKLGLNPAGMVFLPMQVFDPAYGEIGYDLPWVRPAPATVYHQVLMFDGARIYLGNTARVTIS